MNILHISQILPIPGIFKTNDFVFKLADYQEVINSEDKLFFIKPIPYTNSILSRHIQLNSTMLPPGFRQYNFNNYFVRVFKFLSARRFNNLHALLIGSIYWLNRKSIKELLARNRIDVVHAQFIFTDGLLAYFLKKKFNIPYIITTHTEMKYFKSFLSKKLALAILRDARAIIPLNRRNVDFYKKCGMKRVELIPIGIDQEFFTGNDLALQHDTFSILTVGELIKLKNIDKILMAVSSLRSSHKIRLTIVGKGPEEEPLKILAQKLEITGIVDFLGFVPYEKIPAIMASHDLFVLPSFPETFGRVYFEAMACGLPVICAINSGIYGYFPDLVDRFAVDHENTEELTARIRFFADNRETTTLMGQQAKTLMLNFTWEKIALRIRELYTEAIDSVKTGY
jgi:glycosyltransferase involved in cell wall biosynthesis